MGWYWSTMIYLIIAPIFALKLIWIKWIREW